MKTEPLLSDDRVNGPAKEEYIGGVVVRSWPKRMPPIAVRDLYEIDRTKTRALLQSLVDALWQFEGAVVYVGWDEREREKHKAAKEALSAAAEHGITPSAT